MRLNDLIENIFPALLTWSLSIEQTIGQLKCFFLVTMNIIFKMTSIYLSSKIQVHNSYWVSNMSKIELNDFLTHTPQIYFSSNILRLNNLSIS